MIDKNSADYKQGWSDAIASLNEPKLMIQKDWNPSHCPNCNKSYSNLENCDDGYYERATSLIRCPYCGQRIKWDDSDFDPIKYL